MHVNGAHVARIIVAPHQLQQVFPAVDFVGVQGEKLKQIEFPGGQVHLSARDVNAPAVAVQLQIPYLDDFCLGLTTVFGPEASLSRLDVLRMIALILALTSRILKGFVI